MPEFRRFGPLVQVGGLLLLVVLLTAGGSIWFHYLGVIDAVDTFAPVLRLVGVEPRPPVEAVEDPELLEAERAQVQAEALAMREEELVEREREIEEQFAEIERRREELEQREREIEDREFSFNERVRRYENRREAVIQNSRDLTNMPPAQAVQILESYDDQDLVELFRVTEEIAREEGTFSFVPLWLAELPPERAAEVQRKLTVRAEQ